VAAGVVAASAAAAGPLATIDSTPPAATNNITATFTFHAASKTATFLCKLDSGTFAVCTSPHTITGLSEAEHTFAVKTNAHGDTPATYTWTVDLTPPDTIVSAHPPALSNSSTSTFVFTSDDPTATFRCTLNGSTPQPCTSPLTYTGLADATRTLTIAAVDPAGNVDPMAPTFTWTVDTTPPDTTIADPGDIVAKRTITFMYSSTEPGSTFECSLGAAAFAACPASGDTVTIKRSGSHQFRVRAIDPAGNVDPTPASFTWTADITPPANPKLALFPDPSASMSALPATSPLTPLSGLGVTVVTPVPAPAAKTPAFSLSSKIRAQWSSDATAVSYDVAVLNKVESTDAFAPPPPTERTYHATTKTALVVNAQPGNTVCVAVRARDNVGNVSGTTHRCTTVPYSFAPPWNTVGYHRVKASRAWHGYYIRMQRYQAIYGLVGLQGNDIPNRVAIVAEHCSECGKIEVGWVSDPSGNPPPPRPRLKQLAVFNLRSSHKTGTFAALSASLSSKHFGPGALVFEAISGTPHLSGIGLRSDSLPAAAVSVL
jgi:hypothetical protein